MFKALLRKQLYEINTWLFQNKKQGKRRSKGAIMAALTGYIALLAVLGVMFGFMAKGICVSFYSLGFGWLYFTLISIGTVLLGVFGSVFSTYASLYSAKDNEILLSMPIPPRYILAVRLFGVWFLGAIFSAVLYLPAFLVYLIFAEFSFGTLLLGTLTFFVLSIFVLTLSALLGFVVAKITAKLKKKSFLTVIFSLTFIVLYYLFYFRVGELIGSMLNDLASVGGQIKTVLPLYWLGAASLEFLPFLWIFLIVAAFFGLLMLLMDHSFLKMATVGNTVAKKEYREKKTKYRGVSRALFFRELRHFSSSAAYMLNCSLGTIFLPAIGIFALVKRDFFAAFATQVLPTDLFVLICCFVLCVCASMNDITAPAVSLEGKTVWIVQSLPIDPFRVLFAKIQVHLLMTEPAIFVAAVLSAVAVKLSFWHFLLLWLVPSLFSLLLAVGGLVLGTVKHNLSWTSEITPIKQSAAVFFTMFGGFVLVALLGALYFALRKYLAPTVYMVLVACFLIGASAGLFVWLKKRGCMLFSHLS